MTNINYIITCGTSQFDKEKFMENHYYAFTSSEDFDNFMLWHEDNYRNDKMEPTSIQRAKEKIIKRLVVDFNAASPSSFLGAELSTIKLRRKELPKNQEIKECYHIIASDTPDGYLSANILHETLKKIGLKGYLNKVIDLTEEPKNPGMARDALVAFVDELLNSLTDKATNICVYCGGFKSLIPCITLFSILFGLEMIYNYKGSEVLQVFEATQYLHNPTNRQRWIQDSNRMLYGNRQQPNPWLNRLFTVGETNKLQFYG
jgi:CRISPR/Cas system-associated protein Csm6